MLSERFIDALTFAARLHATQRRKVSGEPYVAHLLAVTATVLEHGGSEEAAIAALLHDAVEDQGGRATRDEIGRRFGEAVAIIVDGCTDADTLPKPPWRQRKERYVAQLRTAPPEVRLISAADKLHNARSMLRAYDEWGPALWGHFRGGRDGTLWYLRAVVDALRAGNAESGPVPPRALVEELAATVERLAACE